MSTMQVIALGDSGFAGEVWLIPAIGMGAACVATMIGWLYIRVVSPPVGSSIPAATAPNNGQHIVANGSERRAHPRIATQPTQVILVPVDSREVVATGTLLDRSLGGLGLNLDQEVPLGVRLRLRPVDDPPGSPWIQVEIRYCRQRGDSWRVGCQFVEVSAWEVMNMFGPPDPDEVKEANRKKALALKRR